MPDGSHCATEAKLNGRRSCLTYRIPVLLLIELIHFTLDALDVILALLANVSTLAATPSIIRRVLPCRCLRLTYPPDVQSLSVSTARTVQWYVSVLCNAEYRP